MASFKKKILLLAAIFGFLLHSNAQDQAADTLQRTVAGSVLNKDGDAFAGVNITIKDSPGAGVVSGSDGRFHFTARIGNVLVFSYAGYQTQEYTVLASIDSLRIAMQPSDKQLDDVVVVGIGAKQRKISLVGAVTSVNVKELQQPATSINNMLGGRVPGIIAVQGSGEPGKNISEFWIRGIGTFGANSGALVLIDGLEGDLSRVDPADVESFSVLKDASATAVYGIRGANGVVVITTKRGESQKLKVTARVSETVSRLTRLPDYAGAYDYARLANEASVVSGKLPVYDDVQMELIKNNLDPDILPNTNWQQEILRPTSFQQTYYINVQGGGSLARYFLSLGMSNETAAYKQSDISKYKKNVGYNTYTYRSNLDFNMTKSTLVSMNVDGSITVNNLPGAANTNWLWSAQARLTPLTVPKQYSNGYAPAYGPDDQISPYVLLNETGMTTNQTYRNAVSINVKQNLDAITKGLSARIQGGFDNRSYFNETRYKMPDLYNAIGRNDKGELIFIKRVNAVDVQYNKTQYQWRRYQLEGNIAYDRAFGLHRVGGLAYYYMSSDAATNFTTSLAAIPKRYQGISSQVNYGYDDTYLLSANFGYTGSENFKEGERFGFFPSVAVGWVPSQYRWVKDHLSGVNFFKIRFSYGLVGNDRISDDRFPYLTIINTNAPGGWGGSGLIESVVGADNLRWEVSKKADLGIEGRFLNNNLEFVIDFFNDQRSGIFQKRTQLPAWVGSVTMPYGNVGSMRSWGADGNASYKIKLSKDYAVTVRGNFTYATNEVTNWEQPYQQYEYLSYTGRPYNVLRGFKAIGLFKDEQDVLNSPTQFGSVRPGDIKYKDINGDGVITDDDRVPLSYSEIPRLMYGMGLELSIKKLVIGVLLRGTGRTDYFKNNNGYGYVPFYGGATGNVLSIVNDQANRWTPAWYSGDPSTEDPNALYPRLTYGQNPNNDKYSSFWLGDARYLRLQEVSANYALSTPYLQSRLGIASVNLQFVGYNMAVWDQVKIWDPELAKSNGYTYPIPKRYAFQVYLNF